MVECEKSIAKIEGNHIPIVEGIGYAGKFYPGNVPNLFVGIDIETDAYLGYTTDLYYLDSSTDYFVANPSVYIDASFRTTFEISLLIVDYQVTFSL